MTRSIDQDSPGDGRQPACGLDREAFCNAALGCRERLWGYALRLTRDRAEAEDLLQLTYVRAFERWQSLRELDAIGGWMLRTMHRAFVDRCRRNTRSAAEPLDELAEPPMHRDSSPAERTAARDSVAKALEQLAAPLAQAITLRDVWGFSYDEIAELMDCPIGTVRSRIARARAQMLEHLRAPAAALANGDDHAAHSRSTGRSS